MIITVFVTTNSEEEQWRSELLEHSWQQTGQPGELVRLVAVEANEPLPVHAFARVIRTRPWEKHPYIADTFAAYNKPAALLEWLMSEQVDATILLLDSESILLRKFDSEVAAGEAQGHSWKTMPSGEGPFALGSKYVNLQAFCVNRELNLPKVQYPLLIHSSDLKKLAARWLELTGIIRCEVGSGTDKTVDADKVAYAIAAAEYRIPHKSRKMAAESDDKKADCEVLNYRMPIKSSKARIVWDIGSYQPWKLSKPEQAAPGMGRTFLSYLLDYATLRESGGHLDKRRPRRRPGVREAHVMENMLLEIPGEAEPLTLNSSAASIWKLCDGHRTLGDIVEVLQLQFQAPKKLLCADVELTINHLHTNGAVDLEIVT